jgi:branched-chain amino acid transport system ATP-binding protein
MDVVDRLRGEGSSVLLVEQDVAVALGRAGRGYVLENARIVLAGTDRALMADARVRAAYLGLGAAT